MASAIDLIQSAVNGVEGIDTERTGTWFWEYGDVAMKIRLEYYIDDFERWKAVKNEVNQDVQRAFDEAEIEMAAPTRSLRIGADAT